MKTKSIIYLNMALSALALCFAASCTTEEFNTNGGADETIDGGSSGTMTTPDISGDTGELLNFTVEFDETDASVYGSMTETIDATDEDFIENASFTSTVNIVFDGTTASVTNGAGVTVTTDGAHVTVNSAVEGVEYVLSGSTTNGSLKVYSDYKMKITLSGVTITNPSGVAINIQSSKRAYIVSEEGTSNTLTDGTEYTSDSSEDMKGCLFSEGQLVFSGTGNLSVAGNYKHAIVSDDYVRFRSGCNVAVTAAAKDGVHANDEIIIGGGTVYIESSDDAMQCEAGGITMTGGFVSAKTTADKGHALNSYSYVYFSGGALQASTSGYGAKGISADGDVTITGGKITAITTGGSYYDSSDAELSSAAGIKCDGNLSITGGVVALSSSGGGGKGINCDGTLEISGDTVKVITSGTQATASNGDSTSPKGIKSDGALTISGGVTLVKATGGEGSEGIESKSTMTITGGTIVAYCYDDGLNSAGNLTISGGNVYAFGSNNDGIDSNSSLTISGGTVVAVGGTSPEEAFDCDGTFRIDGGTVVGVSPSNLMTTPSTNSAQRSLIYTGSGSSGQLINVQTSDGTNLVTYELPMSFSSMAFVYSGANLTSGLSCVLYKGGTASDGSEFCGYHYGDYTYSGGTQTASFTLSSVVTQTGTSSGNQPGGNPGGGQRW